MIRLLLVATCLMTALTGKPQTVSGNLPLMAGETIHLKGFSGFTTYTIDSTIIDASGHFRLSFDASDYGMGYLIGAASDGFFVVLADEHVVITGDGLSARSTLRVEQGPENLRYAQYAGQQQVREQALSAWQYLSQLYQTDSLFASLTTIHSTISAEISRINREEAAFFAAMPANSYVGWFLPVRNLVVAVEPIARQRQADIPATIQALRRLDFSDNRLYKSGLYREALESHFWLLENSGMALNEALMAMKVSIDTLINQLQSDDHKLNEVTNYLFDLLERHSLFAASEHLALRVLNETNCTLETELAKQLETYRTMKKGNIAPDLFFQGGVATPHGNRKAVPERLSELGSTYTVVVFAAGWCPKCRTEIPEIAQYYEQWSQKGVEVILISLDANEPDFREFVSGLPFLAFCDYLQWDSPMASAFHVFSTPTLFVLDNERRILLRPYSAAQLISWVDWYVLKGNLLRQ